jgi:hypothetical protein
MTTSAHPPPIASASAENELAREFAEWQIVFRPSALSVVTAFWRSADGRSRRYVVCRSGAELLARLRETGPVQ